MRTLEPPNRLRIGMMGILVMLLVIGVGQSFTSVPMIFAKPSYYGQFTDTGGLSTGDKVRIAGMDVGKVEGLKIDGDHIVIKFSIGTYSIGTESRLAIRTDTILGKKVLEIEARGNQRLVPGASLPLGQSTTPYQIYDAFFDVTKAAQGWNIDTVKESLHVLSETVDQTYPHLSAALDGVAKFSDTIGKRDEEVTHLLAQANQVASILGDRSQQFDRLLVNAKTLIAAFNERGQAINALLSNVAAFSEQVKGLINDNPNLNHVLEQLRTLSEVLVQRKDDLAKGLTEVGAFLPSLNEAIASGPYFKVVLHNIAQGQIVQPFIDAAFQRRGLDPENFWRGAALPAYRWPDPNGTRFPNGAPPPAPNVLEGTPDHPGPAVPPGSPCSYAPANPNGNVTIGDGGPAAAVESAAVCGCDRRPVRRPRLPRTDRRPDFAAGPERFAAHAGHPGRRTPGRPAPQRSGHTGAAAGRTARRAPRAGATGTVRTAAGLRAGSAPSTRARAAAAGAVDQSRRIRR